MKHQRSARTRLLHFLVAALGVALLAGCGATPFAFRGSPKVAALNENDVEEVALWRAGRLWRVQDRTAIRRPLRPELYVHDSLPDSDAATGYETVVVTFLMKKGVKPMAGNWATGDDLTQPWKEFDNRVSVQIYHAPAFALLFDEFTNKPRRTAR